MTGDTYLHLLQSWLMDRLAADKDEDFIFSKMAVLEIVTEDMLQRVWDELDYRLDVCRVRVRMAM